ncbi:hypothetical protein ACFLZN_01265 [Nanoarchaeota archaeon]
MDKNLLIALILGILLIVSVVQAVEIYQIKKTFKFSKPIFNEYNAPEDSEYIDENYGDYIET